MVKPKAQDRARENGKHSMMRGSGSNKLKGMTEKLGPRATCQAQVWEGEVRHNRTELRRNRKSKIHKHSDHEYPKFGGQTAHPQQKSRKTQD